MQRVEPPIQFPPEAELASLQGQWVALVRGVVVGSGKTALSALKGAKNNGHQDPLICHVPLFPPAGRFFGQSHNFA